MDMHVKERFRGHRAVRRGPMLAGQVYHVTAATQGGMPWFADFHVACEVVRGFHQPAARGDAMLLAWVLPLDILARSILQEKEHGTGGLVFAAPQILRRLLAARFAASFALLLVLTLPGVLRLLATAPAQALAAILVSASIASWGLSLGALFRHARPFELLLITAAYVALQGTPLFDLQQSAHVTALWHALALLPAMLLARCALVTTSGISAASTPNDSSAGTCSA